MLSALFVSDIHIQSMQDPKAALFLSFLHELNSDNCSHLFLVGDIFDLWIADHDFFIKEYQPLISQLKRLRSDGVEVHYFEGNHDLHLKSFWENELGVKVHTQLQRFQLGSIKLAVEHGDESNPDDRGYLFLRGFLRSRLMTFLAHHLPSPLVVRIGKRSSSTSRNYTSEIKKVTRGTALEKLHKHAVRVYEQVEYDFLVNGHVHEKDRFVLPTGAQAWNLGTWLKEPGYLKLTTEGASWHSLSGE